MRVPALTVVVFAGGLLTNEVAFAQDAARACIVDSDEGQRLRDEGKLTSARPRFARCADDACPNAIRKACAAWLADVEERQPQVVLAARDAGGQDLVRVHVTMDGAPLTDVLDGRAVAVDPGPHTFRFEASPAPPVAQTIVVLERDKTRVVSVVIDERSRPASSATVVAPPPRPPEAPPHRIPAPVYVLGGLGIVALGGFAYFGLTGQSDKNDLADTCAPQKTCAESDVAAARVKLIVADVSLGVAVVAIGVAAYWLIDDRVATARSAPAALRSLDVRLFRNGAMGGWRGSF